MTKEDRKGVGYKKVEFKKPEAKKRTPLNTPKTKEKVEYRGDYRIVGLVEVASKHVGYVLADTKTYQIKLFTITQTTELLKQAKFENAELTESGITNTECSMDRLMKFNQQGKVIANKGVTILGRIIDEAETTIGFRVLNQEGHIVNLRADDLLKAVKASNLYVVNGKIVNQGGSTFVSAIKGNFKRIEIEEIPQDVRDNLSTHPTKSAELVAEEHRNFLMKIISKQATKFFAKGQVKVRDLPEKSNRIFLKEVVKDKFPVLMDKELNLDFAEVKAVTILLLLSQGLGIPKWNSRKQFSGVLQPKEKLTVCGTYFSWNEDLGKLKEYIPVPKQKYVKTPRVIRSPFSEEIIKAIKTYDKTGDVTKFLKAYNNHLKHEYTSNAGYIDREVLNKIKMPLLRSFLASFYNEYALRKGRYLKHEDIKYNTATLDYSTVEGVEELGLTLDGRRHGTVVPSILYSRKAGEKSRNGLNIFGGVKLRYVYRHMPFSNEVLQKFSNNVSCYGDLKILEDISILCHYHQEAQVPLYEYHTEFSFYIFILAMHNPEFAKLIENYMGIYVPFNIDEVAKEDFFLKDEDKLYYQSGLRFNRPVDIQQGEGYAYLKLNEVPKVTLEAFNVTMASVMFNSKTEQLPLNNITSTPNLRKLLPSDFVKYLGIVR